MLKSDVIFSLLSTSRKLDRLSKKCMLNHDYCSSINWELAATHDPSTPLGADSLKADQRRDCLPWDELQIMGRGGCSFSSLFLGGVVLVV